MKKKFLVILLAVMVAVSCLLFVACSGGSATVSVAPSASDSTAATVTVSAAPSVSDSTAATVAPSDSASLAPVASVSASASAS